MKVTRYVYMCVCIMYVQYTDRRPRVDNRHILSGIIKCLNVTGTENHVVLYLEKRYKTDCTLRVGI
jgi:hypothetical protein